MTEKTVNAIGWFASAMAILMYFSYIDQILLNMAGHHGSLILPLATVVNCTAWTLYGILKSQKDFPIIFCNIPGIFLGGISAFTAL